MTFFTSPRYSLFKSFSLFYRVRTHPTSHHDKSGFIASCKMISNSSSLYGVSKTLTSINEFSDLRTCNATTVFAVKMSFDFLHSASSTNHASRMSSFLIVSLLCKSFHAIKSIDAVHKMLSPPFDAPIPNAL